VGPERAELLRYDRGEPFGDEQEGRSQIVSRDCHDTRVGLLPSIQRVFFGAERVMEFEPGGEDDVALAEQQTDYVHHVIMRQNEGYEILSDAFVDALRQKAGFVKAWWSEERTKKRRDYTGLDAATLALVMEEHGARDNADIDSGRVEVVDGVELYSVTVTWEEVTKRIKIAAIPPEELLINRGARCLDSARLVAHRRMATRSELVAMGVEAALLEGAGGDDGFDGNPELIARNAEERDDVGEGANERILYVESYVRLDYDGDGIAELRRICTVGDDCRPISNEPVDERPIADFRCLREPHTFFPEAVTEKVKDVQRIKSMTLRAVMDSLALSTNPRMMYDPSKTTFEDVANGEIGALIAVKSLGSNPQAVMPLETPFVGAQAFPVLDYLDAVRENRTGVSKAAAGLDASALQGSSKLAVAGTYSRADAQAETICRDFAEGGMKRLYRLVLRLTAEHQDQVRVRARTGKWVMVDPAEWKLDLNLGANVVIGVMSDEEKLATLDAMATRQEAIIQQLGPANPFCNLRHLHSTYSKMLAIRGWKSPAAFFTDPETIDPTAFTKPDGPPQPTPEQTLAQAQIEVERMRTEKTLAIEERKLELRAREIALEDDRVRDQLALKHQIELTRIEAEYGFRREQVATEALVGRTRRMGAGEPGGGGVQPT
jgi:hypothetical protein